MLTVASQQNTHTHTHTHTHREKNVEIWHYSSLLLVFSQNFRYEACEGNRKSSVTTISNRL